MLEEESLCYYYVRERGFVLPCCQEGLLCCQESLYCHVVRRACVVMLSGGLVLLCCQEGLCCLSAKKGRNNAVMFYGKAVLLR